jgi:hypothetical protein
MGSAIQAGGRAISRCRNWELNTAGPGNRGGRHKSPRRAQIRGWPAKCPWPPSSIKRDCGGSTTSTDKGLFERFSTYFRLVWPVRHEISPDGVPLPRLKKPLVSEAIDQGKAFTPPGLLMLFFTVPRCR